jgi:hypothetical protein
MTAPRCCGRLRPDPLARARQCLLLLHGGFAAAQAGPPLSLCVCLLSPEAAAEGEDQLLAAGLQVMTQAGMFCPCISRIKLAPEEEMGERKVEAWDTFQALPLDVCRRRHPPACCGCCAAHACCSGCWCRLARLLPPSGGSSAHSSGRKAGTEGAGRWALGLAE